MLARNGPLSATNISARFPVSPPAISQHLKVLREAHVVVMEKRAQQRMYQLNPDAMVELEHWAQYRRAQIRSRLTGKEDESDVQSILE